MFKKEKEKNYFNSLGFSPYFQLSLNKLEQNYLRFIALIHPDRNGSNQASYCLNQAYQILINPLLRAYHLLYLFCKKINMELKIIHNLILLQQFFEDRERLAIFKKLEILCFMKLRTQKFIQNVENIFIFDFGRDPLNLMEVFQKVSTFSYYVKYLDQIKKNIFKKEDTVKIF